MVNELNAKVGTVPDSEVAQCRLNEDHNNEQGESAGQHPEDPAQGSHKFAFARKQLCDQQANGHCGQGHE